MKRFLIGLVSFCGTGPAWAGPPPQLAALRSFEGDWACDGKAPAGPMGPARAYASTITIARGLADFWVTTEYHQTGAGMAGRGYVTWDPGAKRYLFRGFFNSGGWAEETVAVDGARWVGTGETVMGGGRVGWRETMTREGERLVWRGEMRPGKEWIPVGEDSCRRAAAASERSAPMTVTAIFDIPGMTRAQYDQVIRDLEAAGQGNPHGRLYHVASPSTNGWNVVDVWDSPQSFEKFGQVLMPILLKNGVKPPPPRVLTTHHVIRG